MLALDDPRWNELAHRMGLCGERSDTDPEAPIVPEELAKLLERPSDLQRFNDLWPYLCSEGTAWSGAYAVVPYAVKLARQLPPEQRLHYLCFVGLVVQCSDERTSAWFEEVPPYLEEDYRAAVAAALPLVLDTLLHPLDKGSTRYLLATAAALKGHVRLADALLNLDCICAFCSACDAAVYPEELQKVVEDEIEAAADAPS